jgi:hypothetical protein
LPSNPRAGCPGAACTSRSRVSARLGCLSAVLLLAVSACSSGPSAGSSYEQIVSPANSAWSAFVTQARTWANGTIPSSGATLTQDVVKTWEQANRQLQAHKWPGRSQADVAALIRSDFKVCQILRKLPSSNAAAAWWSSLIASFSAEQTAAGKVRQDLRLPISAGPRGAGSLLGNLDVRG